MARKHAMFYNAMGRGDHARFMMMKSLVCSDTVAEAETIDARFPDVRAYIASLRPPTYPFRTDPALARQGEAVFRSHCQACHGSYGPSGSYPNLVIGLDQVGTDPEYALAAHDRAQRFMEWFNTSWYGSIASARPAPGYVAPPLDGIWATAPYLHNGSVPTLQALLDSRLRPTFWSRNFDSEDFDEQAVGWHYRVLETGKAQEADAALRKRIYDTTLPGYANTGHLFGDHLEAGQRRAVIEYLKTL
jgi:mono/diheme cytochrome c family protein